MPPTPSTLLAALCCGAILAGAQVASGKGSGLLRAAPSREEPAYPPGWIAIESFGGQPVETVLEAHPDGRLRRIATYASGRRDAASQNGPEWTYWPNGALQARRVLLRGKQHGPASSYYESGMLESAGEYRDDGREGRWSFYNERGDLKEVREYQGGELHGRALVLFADGSDKLEREFEHSLQVGVEREWTDDGQLLRLAHYRGGRLHGDLERTDPEGNRHVEQYEDGKKSGTWTRSNEGGVKVLEEAYRDDLLHGTRTRWRPDGSLAFRMEYVEGRAEGELTAWHDNGQMQMQGVLTDDRRTGRWHYWRRDGTTIETWSGVYADDRKVGD